MIDDRIDVFAVAEKLYSGSREFLIHQEQLNPYAFLVKGKGVSMFPMRFTDGEEKESMAERLKEECLTKQADALIIVVDSFIIGKPTREAINLQIYTPEVVVDSYWVYQRTLNGIVFDPDPLDGSSINPDAAMFDPWPARKGAMRA